MPRVWRLTTGLPLLAPLVVARALAQPAPAPPETLETPYQDAPATAPVAPPEASPPPGGPPPAPPPTSPPAPQAGSHINLEVPTPDTRPLPSIRARRRLALTGEVSWNGLAGFGPVLTYYPNPHIGLDLGLGVSALGWKGGLRARYNLLKSPLTPFVGLGLNAASGWGQVTDNSPEDPNGNPRERVTIEVDDSYLVQGVVGIDYMHRRGFTLLSCLGYAYLLNKDNYRVLAGELTAEEKQGFDVLFKGGLVLSVSLGYAWE